MQTPDFATARLFMVNGQVRPNKVTDPRLLAALRSLPRERFLPAGAAPLAYADEDVPLGGGRVLLAPLPLSRLVQAILDANAGSKALVIGAGPGYGAAVLAACGFSVTACEHDPALLALARPALAAVGSGVTLVEAGPADLPKGPFDVILIEGGFEILPPAIPARLSPRGGGTGGRLFGIRRDRAGTGQAVEGEMTTAGLALRPLFDAFTTCLPGLEMAPSFVF
ncbi:MAG: protein-L-isoaspartate O-methyltransferase [Rhodospirillales bacterium]|nr:protein-L-isoaspartate O-methyltransferase [Rhodospirillales bacterium]